MIIHPDLRALRSDDAPQCDAQEAMGLAIDAWQARPAVAALQTELERFALGGDIADFPLLAALFAAGNSASRRLCNDFTSATCAMLADLPLGHVPLRHFTDGVTSTLLMARAVNVTLSLVALDGEGLRLRPPSSSVSFGPIQTWEYVLGGSAGIEDVTCEDSGPAKVSFQRHKREIGPDSIHFREGRRAARLLHRIDGALVSLRLQRRLADADLTREYDLASGVLLHQAAGNPRDSRMELMLALLGRMQRQDAAPLMADLALGGGSAALRWQSLRECLALDTRIGFAALAGIAKRPDDPLRSPGEALQAQLVNAYPQLQELEPCPA